jgi:hypothetical protein
VSVRRVVRFHYSDGRVVTQSVTAFAAANDLDRRGALDLLIGWLLDGSISERKDGGFDVHRYHPPKHQPVQVAAGGRPRPAR